MRITLPDHAARPATVAARADMLAAEEPLGIRVDSTALTMTMRTPGDDIELAAGFLVGEAVIRSPEDIAEIKLCDGTACGDGDHDGLGNIADVTLAPGVAIPPGARRNFLTTSAGAASAARQAFTTSAFCRRPRWPTTQPASNPQCWRRSRKSCATPQRIFARSGGLHAAGCSPPTAT
jgi:FdhD protein